MSDPDGSDATRPAIEAPSAHEDLAATVHETTNALTVILGWLHRASKGPDEATRARALERATECAMSARHLMRRAIGAEMPEQPTASAGQIAQRALEDLAIEARDAAVALSSEVDPAAADRRLENATTVWQILVNLLLNAISVTPAGRRVELVIDAADAERVRLSVRDEGPGVDPALARSIFEARTTTRPGGAGIGLHHARALAVQSGGRLVLGHSDHGACFELSWPCLPAEEDPDERHSAPPSSERAGLKGVRVLLLEDDIAVVELLELGLEARGALLQTCRTVAELEAALREGRRYDVLLMDLSPLEEIGLDPILTLARADNAQLVVVVISGSVSVQPRRDIVWVRKPFEIRELVSAILSAGTDARRD